MFSRTGMTYEQMCQSYDIDVARYNYMISPNKFCSEIFPSAFGVSKEKLIETANRVLKENGFNYSAQVFLMNEYFNTRTYEDFTMPAHHPVLDMDISDKEFEVLRNAYEIQPENYEELILLKGIGPKKIRALALISDLVYGEPASWKDPVKYSFTHGGKDGFPYPVDREVYDNSIETMRDAIDQARIKKDEKLKAIKRLDDFIS